MHRDRGYRYTLGDYIVLPIVALLGGFAWLAPEPMFQSVMASLGGGSFDGQREFLLVLCLLILVALMAKDMLMDD